MRLRPNRYSFAFLALIQSLLVLLGVVYLFNWFESTEMESIRSNTLETTEATASRIDRVFKTARETKEQTGKDGDERCVERFRAATEGFTGGQDTCVLLAKAHKGSILSHRNKPPGFDTLSLGSVPFQPISRDDANTLVNIFSSNPDLNSVSGRLLVDGQQWIGSARRLPRVECILLVLRNDSARMHQQAVVFSQKRTRALLWALGLSFLAITVPIVGLHHNVDQIRATNSNLERQATHNERELTRTRNAVIFGLAKLAESRDNDTGEHLDRIRKYVEIISRDLANHCNDIDEEFTRNISLASSLHDIGKVGIPDSILLKPGRLTPEERSMMQIHTLIGGECLDAIHARLGNNPFMHMARQIAYYHHERWDGEGYPHQLKEYDIPLVARIVAVADVYDALTSKRPYKRAMSHLESRAIIVSGSGSQFDPEVVAAFIRHEDEFEAISRGQQSLSDDQAKSAFAKLHGEAQAASEKEAQTS
jgi:HD-GYP domain-containing protein (c-di-GMP phosphodiesterase class II)